MVLAGYPHPITNTKPLQVRPHKLDIPFHSFVGHSPRCFYTLHKQTNLLNKQHRSFYTRKKLLHRWLLHTDTFTHRLLHTDTFTQRLLHTDAFTHRSFYTQKLLHTNTCAQRPGTRDRSQFYLSFTRSNTHFVRHRVTTQNPGTQLAN